INANDNKIDPVMIIELINKIVMSELQGPDKLRIELKIMSDIAQRIDSIRQLIKTLSPQKVLSQH
ncbi:hypothetical protein, partial [Pelistega indica]|uniref:hypothetical protein n=1 Tax=Pelistega indica TaxID=1414851 RepID=UPI0004CFAA51